VRNEHAVDNMEQARTELLGRGLAV
jgi:hypothetical protein